MYAMRGAGPIRDGLRKLLSDLYLKARELSGDGDLMIERREDEMTD